MSEDEVNATIETTNTILNNDGGQILSLDKWGIRTLAYLIQNETQGYYVFCDYATEPGNVTEMERKFRIDESVMKYMTIKTSDSIDAEGITAARGEYEAAVAAVAEAEAKAEAEAEAAKQDTKQSDSKPEITKDAETPKAEVATEVATEASEATETKSD
jgi:small subunit ribosomal protein S6